MNISHLNTQSADEVKLTFIANVSHELYSPLRSILGTTEFLKEIALDDFQSSLTHAVETCAKTLLNTVEDVLDYSKINQMANKLPRKKRRKLGPQRIENDTITQSTLRLSLDISLRRCVFQFSVSTSPFRRLTTMLAAASLLAPSIGTVIFYLHPFLTNLPKTLTISCGSKRPRAHKPSLVNSCSRSFLSLPYHSSASCMRRFR